MGVHSFAAANIRGQAVQLNQYEGKVLLIANTASKCGFTPQYADLHKLYEKYRDQGLVILGFPCNQFGGQEPGSNSDVDTFCQINYGVTFPLFEKVDVRGDGKHPLFGYLTEALPFEGFDLNDGTGKMLHNMLKEAGELEGNDIKWNFTKFLIDKNGNPVQRFESNVSPIDMESAIEALL
ncbi:glutathione peroxidase [Paenibacillus filicis]|uniref:Glutathione peroxidase n=1 Tax=Paenibacillus gyeongsangnamensis TaxID=3388067 RepID=A0ABT4QLA6_9BACL|nr:glutathione peroxidase [Paenibacillus filicis]MCZ8517625.1 glutathione peroxidase [Paenibacillus filicis]